MISYKIDFNRKNVIFKIKITFFFAIRQELILVNKKNMEIVLIKDFVA